MFCGWVLQWHIYSRLKIRVVVMLLGQGFSKLMFQDVTRTQMEQKIIPTCVVFHQAGWAFVINPS